MIPVPRFIGKATKADNRWKWELIVTFLGDGQEHGDMYESKNTFENKQKAIDDLKSTVNDMINLLSRTVPGLGINVDEYIDMKTNSKRRFDKKDEN